MRMVETNFKKKVNLMPLWRWREYVFEVVQRTPVRYSPNLLVLPSIQFNTENQACGVDALPWWQMHSVEFFHFIFSLFCHTIVKAAIVINSERTFFWHNFFFVWMIIFWFISKLEIFYLSYFSIGMTLLETYLPSVGLEILLEKRRKVSLYFPYSFKIWTFPPKTI